MIREFVGSCFQQITELLLEDEVKLTIDPLRSTLLQSDNGLQNQIIICFALKEKLKKCTVSNSVLD
jgi:hypothetical protein